MRCLELVLQQNKVNVSDVLSWFFSYTLNWQPAGNELLPMIINCIVLSIIIVFSDNSFFHICTTNLINRRLLQDLMGLAHLLLNEPSVNNFFARSNFTEIGTRPEVPINIVIFVRYSSSSLYQCLYCSILVLDHSIITVKND